MHVILKIIFSHSHFVQCLLLYAFIKDEYNEKSFMLILKMHLNLLTKEQKCLLNMDYLTSTPTSQLDILPPGHLNWWNALFSYWICIHSNVSIFKEQNSVLAQHIQTKEKQKSWLTLGDMKFTILLKRFLIFLNMQLISMQYQQKKGRFVYII